ncbi:MAG: aldehyde oxidase [Chloroflexi bacterium 44-23]|nr:MAG: aldehyde oxidase [Chloroflexi bacterium 44-23]
MEIGKNQIRIDAESKVRGEALYPGDIDISGQLHMKVLFSQRAHAIIKKIDISRAESCPGVITILTAPDVPNNCYGLIIPDQPVLCGPGSNNKYGHIVRSFTDQIALIIAETEEEAKYALDLIEVDYDDLAIVENFKEALKPDAPLVHPEKGTNVLLHYKIRQGEVDKAFERSDVIVEGVYNTPVQEHAYLQPEAGLAYFDEEERITVVVSGQWAHEDQKEIAHALNLPLEKVRVIYPAIGGAFGGREDMSVQIILALAVLKLDKMGIRKAVKIIWSREESIIGHHKRHAYEIHSKWGATNDGKLLAAKMEVYADAGAYAYTSTKVQGNATLMCSGAYEIPNVMVDSYTVYTNNTPGGAFRGFGGPQASFSAEMQMNKLAEKLGMDPVEIRMRNVLKEGSYLSVGSKMPPGVSLPEVVRTCAINSGWQKSEKGWQRIEHNKKLDDSKARGVGFACGYKNVGFSFGAPEECWATVEIHGNAEVEKIILRHAGADVGQGSHTIFCQMAADALNEPLEKVALIASDTSTSGSSGSVSASRMTFMAGNSIIGAAKLAKEKWINEERPAIAQYRYVPPTTTPFDKDTGVCEPNFAYGYAAESITVDVDLETGQIDLIDVICADDVGRAINPNLVVGQIEGTIIQAAGYAILENFIQEKGLVKTSRFSSYLIPTALDIPERTETILLEYPDPRGPWGARGVGEMPFIPFAPAVAAAVHAATGVWYDQFPLTPERILRGLGKLDEDE